MQRNVGGQFGRLFAPYSIEIMELHQNRIRSDFVVEFIYVYKKLKFVLRLAIDNNILAATAFNDQNFIHFKGRKPKQYLRGIDMTAFSE